MTKDQPPFKYRQDNRIVVRLRPVCDVERKLYQNLQARIAGAGHVTAAKTRNQPLDDAVIKECKIRGKVSKGEGFAKLIRPKVLKHMDLPPDSAYPSVVDIRTSLYRVQQAVLKELPG